MSDEEVKLWKNKAKESLKDAVYLLEGSRYGAACFFSQQAVSDMKELFVWLKKIF